MVYEALPVDDPQVRQPDITRARELLGWEPEVDVREGLRRTIDFYSDRKAELTAPMSSPEAKNLEAIYKAIDQHNASCEFPAIAVAHEPVRGGAPRMGLHPGAPDPP